MFSGLVAAAALAAAPAPSGDRIDYVITPVLSKAGLTAIAVDVRFRGEADGETAFVLPDEWGGQSKLYGAVSGLAAKGATIRDGAAPHLKVLRHRPGARITVRYMLRQERAGEPDAASGDYYRPVIRPDYFHLIGWTSYARPAFGENAPASLAFRDAPTSWSFASDTEHPVALTLGGVLESVAVGGDFPVLTPSNGKAPGLRVAIRGRDWTFDRHAYVDRVATILSEERAFWGDPDESFLVTLLPLATQDRNSSSIGGTGLTDSFAMFSTTSAKDETLSYVLAHEAMHTWIPRRLGRLADDEREDYWLSEGFTDFFTYRLLARSGLWTPADFAAMFNEMLRAYAFSPERAKPNRRIVEGYWADPVVQKLPYQRGMLFGLLLEQEILSRSQGRKDFDDLILAMRKSFGDGSKSGLAVASFRAEAARLGLDIDALLKNHIEEGAPILLPQTTFAACGGVRLITTPPFDRGFDAQKTQAGGGVIVGVDPDLAAYRAGMRDGMVLVRRESGVIGDPTTEIAYRVRDNGVERVLRYMPHGRGLFDLQQLRLKPDLTGAALEACRASLAGLN